MSPFEERHLPRLFLHAEVVAAGAASHLTANAMSSCALRWATPK